MIWHDFGTEHFEECLKCMAEWEAKQPQCGIQNCN